ncbi:MAG: AbrB/MazE/SpoVT family DNA-binding domain-containing protein, partial [Clostridia bacterium]|nr:AbrB/MazE/SpoVT family DNA-binding domain-containing protein [Clostridia bacterium]
MGETAAVVRRLDGLGRLVLPSELLRTMDVRPGDPFELFVDQDQIVLRKYQPGCIFCGRRGDLISFQNKRVCRECLAAL